MRVREKEKIEMRILKYLTLAWLALNLLACSLFTSAPATPTNSPKPPFATKPTLPPQLPPGSSNAPASKPSPAVAAPTATTASASNLAVAMLPDGKAGLRGDAASFTQKGGSSGATSAKQSNIAFILDASGSMAAKLPNSTQTKIQVAKQVMTELVTQVPTNVKTALWFYGHRYPQEPKEKSCQDIERAFPLGAINVSAYTQAIQRVNTIGYTPIADSLTQAAKDLPAGDNQNNTIILVSDGEETCGGDPCKVAAALKASNSRVTIHVVGYNVEEVARKQLQCVADASGGMYRDASSADLLREALSNAVKAADAKTTLRLEVTGPNNTQVKTKLGLYKPGTKDVIAGYNGWADNPVTPGTYDIVIETTPRVLYSNVNLAEGSGTLIRLNVGAFDFASVAGESPNPYTVAVVDPANKTNFGNLLNPQTEPYYVLPGTFNLELYPSIGQGSPNAIFSRVEIKPLEKITLRMGALDLRGVNNEQVRPYGIKFYDATNNQLLFSFIGSSPKLYYLAPGTYRIELFYSVTAYPQSTLNNVAIKPGETNTITLGAYIVRDASNKDAHPEHTVTDAASGQQVASFSGYSPSRYYIPAGTYNFKFQNSEVKNVVITSGKEVTVQMPK
jgi:Ca-activated chloride channel family protein